MVKVIVAVILVVIFLFAAILDSPLGALFPEEDGSPWDPSGGTSSTVISAKESTERLQDTIERLEDSYAQAVIDARENAAAELEIVVPTINWAEIMAVYAGVMGCTPDDVSAATQMGETEIAVLEDVFWEFFWVDTKFNVTGSALPPGTTGGESQSRNITVTLTLSVASWMDVGERFRLDRDNLAALIDLDGREWDQAPIQNAQKALEDAYAAKIAYDVDLLYSFLNISANAVDWKEVISVYAVKVAADPDNPRSVSRLTDANQAELEAVFWAMNTVDASATVYVEKTEPVLPSDWTIITNIINATMTLTQRTAEEMAEEYGFTEDGMIYLQELLDAGDDLWAVLLP